MSRAIQVNKDVIEHLFHEEMDLENYHFIQKGKWADNGKYSYSYVVFELEGKNYIVNISRSGSYFTDYHYEFDTKCTECKRIEVVTHKWIPKSDHDD